MKQFVKNSIGLAIGLALVAPWVLADAPSAVNGSLGGFSSNAQGGQSPGDWGIPQSSGGQPGAGQASNQSGAGQNSAGQGKGPDAGGYGNGQNTQSGNGQNTQSGNGQNSASQGKGPDGGGYGDQSGSGQNGPGQQNSQSGNGQGEHANDGPTKNNSNNPDGDGSGQGEHANDGPTKNNSNNPDGDNSGSAEGEGPTKNNSNNPDGGQSGNSSGSGSSSSGSSSGGGSNGGDFPPLDPPSDGPYDPSNNGGEGQVPSGCAEAGSQCAQCVQRNEAVVQFNRRYLHVAWSTTHQTLEMTKAAIAFGDGVSQMSDTSLSWQLAGKPQITEAVASLRKTYDNKYRIYINNMEQAFNALNQCEKDDFAVQNLYQQFSGLYLDFVKARYASPD